MVSVRRLIRLRGGSERGARVSTEKRQENKFILITDIVGHTKLIARIGPAYRPMRERHDELFRRAVEVHGPGAILKGTGDGFYAAFDDVSAAVETARAFRLGLISEDWDRFLPTERRTVENHVKVRLGLHSGLVRVTFENDVGIDFDGPPRSLCDKVMMMAQGNQILLTRQVMDQAKRNLASRDEIEFRNFGEYKLRDVADTVEICGLDEPDLSVGLKPVQPPEQRAIVFATISEREKVQDAAGGEFDDLKDLWDQAFDKVAALHAKDSFVKKLPDGSLAAFKNAVEAVRVARDFRREIKAIMFGRTHGLAPKLGLDIGLVTFDYANNRAVDVRDQPVNIAAKICKSSTLSQPFQLVMTRPVRSDAFENMPERAEFTWVCVGRRAIPGEPEPMELWEFQDLQSATEERTLLWIDARAAKDQLDKQPAVWSAFRARLDELIADVNSRRTEQPLLLVIDNGIVAAFKDKVEAVQAAVELRDLAIKEPWERYLAGVKRAGHGDNFLRLALDVGQLKHTREDGLLKDFRGPVVDGVKPILAMTDTAQILLSRELKEQVAAAFPQTDVRWRPVSVTTVNGAAEGNEAFELRKVIKRKLTPAVIGGAIAAVLVLTVSVAIAMRGGRVDPQIAAMGRVNDVLNAAVAKGAYMSPIHERFRVLVKQKDDELKAAGMPDADRVAQLEKYAESLAGLTEKWDNLDTQLLATDEADDVAALATVDDFEKWSAKVTETYAKAEEDPRLPVDWGQAIRELRRKIDDLRVFADPAADELTKLVDEAEKERATLSAMPRPTKSNLESVRKSSDALSAQLLGTADTPGTLMARVTDVLNAATARGSEEDRQRLAERQRKLDEARAAGDFPEEIIDTILTAQGRPNESIRRAGEVASAVAKRLVDATPGMSKDERGAKIKPIVDRLDQFSSEVSAGLINSAELVKSDLLSQLEKAETPEAFLSIMEGAADFRKPEGEDPRKLETWNGEIDALRLELRGVGLVGDAEAMKGLEDLRARVVESLKAPWIKKNQAAIESDAAAITAALAEGSPLRADIARRVADVQNQSKARDQQFAALTAARNELLGLLERKDVGGEVLPAARAWAQAVVNLKARSSAEGADPVALLNETKDLIAKLNSLSGAVAVGFKPSANPSAAEQRVAGALGQFRQDLISAVVGAVDGKTPFDATRFDEGVSQAVASLRQIEGQIGPWLERLKALETALNTGVRLGDQIAGGTTVAAAAAALGGEKFGESPARANLLAAADDVLKRVENLKRVGGLSVASELVTQVRSPGSSASLKIAVWDRLGSLESDGTDAWLDAQSAAAPIVRDVVKTTAADLPVRWAKHFAKLSEEAPIRYAIRERGKFGLADDAATEKALADKPAAAQYNFTLERLRDACIRKVDESVIVAQVAKLEKLAGDAPNAKPLLDALAAARAGDTPGNGGGQEVRQLDLAEAGPGQSGDFEFVGEQGGRVVYRLKNRSARPALRGAAAPQIEFVLVNAPSGQVYISTTEVPVQLFFEVADVRREWGNFPMDGEAPGTWRRPRSSGEIGFGDISGGQPTPSWVNTAPNTVISRLFPQLPEPPSAAHPVNNVSVQAALYMAKVMGCRLPTKAEWQAAVSGQGGPGVLNQANLHDQSFAAFRDALSKLDRQAVIKRSLPGVFPDEPKAAYPHQDGVAFFVTIDKDMGNVGPFKNMIGNVAEWAVDSTPEKLSEITAGDARNWARENAESFWVMGGSAFGEGGRPAADLVEGQKVDRRTLAKAREKGFSDVGVRLAFDVTKKVEVVDAPRERPLSERLCAALDAAVWMKP